MSRKLLLLFAVCFGALAGFAPSARADAMAYSVCDSPYASECFRGYQKLGGALPAEDVMDAKGVVTRKGFYSLAAEASGIPRDASGNPTWTRHNRRDLNVPSPGSYVWFPENTTRPSVPTFVPDPTHPSTFTVAYGDDNADKARHNTCLRARGWQCWTLYRLFGGKLSYADFLDAGKTINGLNDVVFPNWDSHDRKEFLTPAVPEYYWFKGTEVKPTGVEWVKEGDLYSARLGTPVPVVATPASAHAPVQAGASLPDLRHVSDAVLGQVSWPPSAKQWLIAAVASALLLSLLGVFWHRKKRYVGQEMTKDDPPLGVASTA